MSTRTKKIAELNDLARTAMGVASKVVFTAGVNALPDADKSELREKIEKFNDFSEDNDPWQEKDFGAFTHRGEKFFWKIDYYDKSLSGGSVDPSDPSKTTRVLTVMFAHEY